MRSVLYVINDLTHGGAQRVLAAQASSLDAARYRALIASLEIIPGGRAADLAEGKGIAVHRLRAAGELRVAALPRLVSLLCRVRPEVVHTHLAAAGVVARLAARSLGRPRLVSTLHNSSDWEEKSRGLVRLADRTTLRLCDRVVTVSDAVRAALARLAPGLARRAVTVHNGIDLDEFREAGRRRADSRLRLGYGDGDFVVGAVARLDRRKGLDVLLEAAARAARDKPGLRILVVGDGPERVRLEALARLRGLGDRVHFAGDQARVLPFLAAMDVLVAPSRSEGLGVAVIEGLAAGLPVLASRVGGIPEVIEHGVSGRLLPPGDVAAWAQALVELAADPVSRARLAEGAARRARAFALSASASALMELYDGLFDAAAPRAHRALEEAA